MNTPRPEPTHEQEERLARRQYVADIDDEERAERLLRHCPANEYGPAQIRELRKRGHD